MQEILFFLHFNFFLLQTKNILNMDKEILIQKKNKESSLKYNELIKKCDWNLQNTK